MAGGQVELLSRVMRKFDVDGDVEPDAAALGEVVIKVRKGRCGKPCTTKCRGGAAECQSCNPCHAPQAGMQLFPNHPYLHILYANFLLEVRKDGPAARTQLQLASKHSPGIIYRYQVSEPGGILETVRAHAAFAFELNRWRVRRVPSFPDLLHGRGVQAPQGQPGRRHGPAGLHRVQAQLQVRAGVCLCLIAAGALWLGWLRRRVRQALILSTCASPTFYICHDAGRAVLRVHKEVLMLQGDLWTLMMKSTVTVREVDKAFDALEAGTARAHQVYKR